jgi:ribulose-5-phosphate 4-epimerase/fuculose-1-phosphate aldolase
MREVGVLEALREQVWKLHLELPRNDLVKWTGGNVSGRDPETGYVVIKPSGMYGAGRDSGKQVFTHSGGNVDVIFDDLIGIRLNCCSRFGPEASR